MPAHSEFQSKIDVLDIIITILRDHEEALSRLADRFGAICDDASTFEEKVSSLERCLKRLDGLKFSRVVEAVGLRGPLVTVKCRDWLAFRNASQGALLVAFEVTDGGFVFSSVSELFIHICSEELRKVQMLIDGGMRRLLERHREDGNLEEISSREYCLKDAKSAYEVIPSPETVKRWLSSELGVPEERIIEGRVLH